MWISAEATQLKKAEQVKGTGIEERPIADDVGFASPPVVSRERFME